MKLMLQFVGILAIGWLVGDLLKEFDIVNQPSRAELAAKDIEERKLKMYNVCMEEGGWNLPGDDIEVSCRAHAEKNYR